MYVLYTCQASLWSINVNQVAEWAFSSVGFCSLRLYKIEDLRGVPCSSSRIALQAIDIALPEEPDAGAPEVSKTPVYSYAGHVTMGGSFATH